MARNTARLRPERVAEQIRVEVADILQRDMKDPRLGLLTCTRVQVTADLSLARVYVSVLGQGAEQQTTMKVLERAAGFVRRRLGRRLGLRSVPELRFVFDPSVEYGIRLEHLLEESRGDTAVPGIDSETNDQSEDA